jgi:hypothetical protein
MPETKVVEFLDTGSSRITVVVSRTAMVLALIAILEVSSHGQTIKKPTTTQKSSRAATGVGCLVVPFVPRRDVPKPEVPPSHLDLQLNELIEKEHVDGLLKFMWEDGAFVLGQGATGSDNVRRYITEQFGESTFSLKLKPSGDIVQTSTPHVSYTQGQYELKGNFVKCGCGEVSDRGFYFIVWEHRPFRGAVWGEPIPEWRILSFNASYHGGSTCSCAADPGIGSKYNMTPAKPVPKITK